MAEEIRVVRKRGRAATGPGDAEGVRAPTSTGEARREIERTRGRISTTLDALEERVDTTRDNLQAKLNVLRPVREQIRAHHWASLGIAFGTGLLLSMLVGGEEEEEHRARRVPDEEAREERRRWREERRERMAKRERRERSRRRRGVAGLGLGRIPGVLAGAVAAGLRDRARRMMTGGRRAAHPRVQRQEVA